jgi:hypothetical protein
MFGVLSSRRRSHSAAVLLGCHESGHDADHKSPISSHSSDHVLNLAKKEHMEVMQTIPAIQDSNKGIYWHSLDRAPYTPLPAFLIPKTTVMFKYTGILITEFSFVIFQFLSPCIISHFIDFLLPRLPRKYQKCILYWLKNN